MFELTEIVKRAYGLCLSELLPCDGGIDYFAEKFQAVAADGRRYFVKVRTGLDPGVVLASTLYEAGVSEVVAPIKTLQGEIAEAIGDRVVLLYPFVEGTNGFSRSVHREHWRALGSCLRRIHDCQLPLHTASSISREKFAVAGAAEFAEDVTRLSMGQVKDPAEEALAEVIRANIESIHKVIERTKSVGDECRKREWELVPTHADLHVGNLLLADDGGVHIVDWDAPRLSPRECDLMFIYEGGITGLHDEADEASFFQGYGEYHPDLLLLTYFRYARALDDAVAYAAQVTGAPEFTHEQKMEEVRGFKNLFEPTQIVETALRSDERLRR